MSKILVADDQAQFRRSLRVALGVVGHVIQEAADGAEAMDLVRTENPDLVLVDWMMPDIDGVHVCRAIRATSDVPIIMMTAKRNGRLEALAAGADDYISKPFRFDELLGRINSALFKRDVRL